MCGAGRHFYCGEFGRRPPVTLGHALRGIVENAGAMVATATSCLGG